ncbi:hypothetical protein KKH27_00410 [bacterium]|nr:hypothetical protein [bacterium]MBU1985392.1 hypothetical protein [bacterium]
MKALLVVLVLMVALGALAQEPIDPAFDPPLTDPSASGGRVRWNGTIGMVVINGRIYQQFGLRPDFPLGKFGVGLDFTFRFDENGSLKDDEWDDAQDYLEKIYYIRYGLPGDPFYVRVGALDNVTLGYGIIMRRYSNTIQYPEVKRVGIYTEGGTKQVSWQGMFNNLGELDEPGLMAGRVAYNTGLKGLTVGATLAHDGNQFAGLRDDDDDGVPNRLDLFADRNDFDLQRNLLAAFHDNPEDLDYLIENGFLPDVRDSLRSYKDIKESVTLMGADVGIPLLKRKAVSIWTYAQIAKVADYGWGWAFPGMRMVAGPVEIGAEYRHYEKQFLGQFYDFVYEIERVQLFRDSLFITKERTLENLGKADGVFTDVLLSLANLGYAYSWYEDMQGDNFPSGRSIYIETGIYPPPISRLQRVAAYYMQPRVRRLFERHTEGTIYGGKLFFALASNVSLVYDHRVTYYNGESHRTIRVETMITF